VNTNRTISTMSWTLSLAFMISASGAHAGIPLVTPPAGARIIDFDDFEIAPTSFASANALRQRYEAIDD
jgi:hypothetical protein